MTYRSNVTHCLTCGEPLTGRTNQTTCSQLCRTRLHRARKALDNCRARACADIFRLTVAVRHGNEPELAMGELTAIAQYLTAALGDPVGLGWPPEARTIDDNID